MKKKNNDQMYEKPFTALQLASAMMALGVYNGENSDIEHKAEAKRLGGMDLYQMFLANALLGHAEANAMLADSMGVSVEHMMESHRQSLVSSGCEEDSRKLLQFLRWRVLRVAGPIREIAQRQEVGPLPLAGAHAAEALQLILDVCAEGQKTLTASPDDMKKNMLSAKESLTYAIGNIDIMLRLIGQAEDLFPRK
jgi:hypothetical protein